MTAPATNIILNVDDQEVERYVKSRDLRAAGLVVLEATSGREALRLIEEQMPAVVLLDVQLPDISGYDVCRYVKQKWPEVLVLMTSATFTTSGHRTHGLDAGADVYLVQPAEPLELAAAVNSLLRIRRTEDEMRRLNETLEQRVRDRVAELADANAKLKSEIAQRQKAEAALVQSQKMEAIGQLTGGLAHDFNNLLTAVIGNLDLIRARSTEPGVRRWAENAFTAAQRGSKLTSQLLVFSRTQKLSTGAIDVNALIDGMRDLINQSLGANIEVQIELAPGLPPATADANQLELAILNLSINARDAMPGGGKLTIKTGLQPDDAKAVLITVTDTGEGMSPAVAARAFDPFFTTKPPGKGTGLGLSQVYGIVRQSGGDVSIDSEVGNGTTVTIALPRSAGSVSQRRGDSATAPLAASENILLVDDDADVRDITGHVLANLGYNVHQASSGKAALAALEEFVPNLLVVDFSMPGMNGAEVVVAARQRNAALKILFLSGYADSEALENAVNGAPLLRKPFRPIELAAAVRSALDAPTCV